MAKECHYWPSKLIDRQRNQLHSRLKKKQIVIGSYISQSNYTVQSHVRVFVDVRYISLHFPMWLYADKLIVSFVEKWDVLNNKTAVPIDVLQNPNTAQLLALGA